MALEQEMDETAFVAEDKLSDFEFVQAYTNWFTLIDMVSDPVNEQGWHMHHKRMVSDRGLQDWAQSWCAHDQLLHSQFMLKLFIIYPSSATYKKQFKYCKLDQALLGVCGSPHGYMHPGSYSVDAPKSVNNLKHHESGSQFALPHYKPYPKAGPSSFLENAGTSILCIHCGFKGHIAAAHASVNILPFKHVHISASMVHIAYQPR